MKVVINKLPGGEFDLSLQAQREYCELIGEEVYFYRAVERQGRSWLKRIDADAYGRKKLFAVTKDFGAVVPPDKIREFFINHGTKGFYATFLERDDPVLIKIVEELGEEANSPYSKLKVVEIPDDVEWEIESEDGEEWVAEVHRTWG